MKITRQNLLTATEKGILSREQADSLLNFLASETANEPRFDFTHLLYYLGGLAAIGAMTLFMNLGWERFGGAGILAIAILYGIFGLSLTEALRRKRYHIPAGICGTFVIALTPIAICGLQQAMGWWPDATPYRDYHRYIRWHWIFMELGTLSVGAIMSWKYRYPFLLMPIAVTFWYMSMDLAVMLTGYHDYTFRAMVSMWFGLATTLLAFWVDLRSRKSLDYAFWLYLFGVMAFWCGLTWQHSESEVTKFFYFCINLGLIGCGAILVRRVFVVFGALGCACYLGHLAATVFKDSWLFPIALSAIGLGIIGAGIIWQKKEKRITAKIRNYLPQPLKELIDSRMS